MQIKIKGLLAALAASSLALSAHAQFESPGDGVYKDRIDWGVMMDMSGPASGSQGIWTNGFQAFMRSLNERGGINGRRINVMAEDSRFNPAQDKINFEKLTLQTPVLGISGVGYMSDRLKLKAPKVMVVSIESAGGVEYAQFIADAVSKLGGTSSLVTMKITSVDVTPQIQEIIKQKPDFITIYGVPNTAILTMKGMQQYGLKVPAFGISYLLSPQIYASIGAEAGANYNVISCFTPGGADQSAGNREVMAAADKYNHSGQKEDINYVAGWAVGQMVAQAVQLAGPEPTRSKIVAAMSKGFTVDTKGLTAPIVFSPTNQSGPSSFRMIGYDYNAKRYTAFGEFRDYDKFMK